MTRPTAQIICTALLIVNLSACTGENTRPYHTGGYTLAHLQEDYDQYVDRIRRDHPKTFTDRTALERTIATQIKLLRDGMSETEFFSVIAPVGAAVRCGHTRTYLSERGHDYFTEHGLCIPLEIRLAGDSLYVYKDFTPDAVIPRGSRVLSVNGVPDTTIVRRMRASLPADGTNTTYKDYAINRSFARLFTLLYGGGPKFEPVVKPPGAPVPVSYTLRAISPRRSEEVDRERYPQETDCRRLCMDFSGDASYAVLTVRDFGYYNDLGAFRRPVGDFFARIARDSVNALIIDVRGNDGGDPYCSSFIVSHVVPQPVQYFASDTPFYDDLVRPIPVPEYVFTGELIVLIDGWCFSSTGHMLSLLRCYKRGVLMGEESGGAGACNDASKEYVLKHTRLRLNLPRATFATSARCLPPGRGIPPDIEVQPTIDDLIAGRDIVLETAISLLKTR
jgi:hypothetical protein